MTLTRKQVVDHAVGLFRGAQGQSDVAAERDAAVAVDAQPTWSEQDKAAVKMVFARLLAVKDDALAQQNVLEDYLTE